MKPTNPPSSPSARGAHAGHPYSPEELHNLDVAHEHSDINIRAIVASAVALAVITAIVFALMGWTFQFFDAQARETDPPVSPLAAPPTNMPGRTTDTPAFGSAPKPQLLTNEYAALEHLRAAESTHLQGSGWVNEQAGIARIPVAEAKQLLLQRGLPVRETAAAKDPALGTHRPAMAESSSGRTATGPRRQ